MKLNEMSYNQLLANLKKGNISISDIRAEYQKSRAAANEAIRRIEKSDVPFTSGAAKPVFTPSSQVPDKDILKALADVNRFRNNPWGTVRGRHIMREEFKKEINKGRSTDLVTDENYPIFLSYMEWFRDEKINSIFGSKDNTIETFFEENWQDLETADKKDWDNLFDAFVQREAMLHWLSGSGS